MRQIKVFRSHYLASAVVALSACAGSGAIIHSPDVDLAGVELTSADFRRQTFLLSFDISNPNPFPLPVKAIEYRVAFDDEKFAGGETQGSFTVPAQSSDSFAISVDLDILSSATRLTSLLRGGLGQNVSYQLQGSLAVDIPFVKPIPFSSSGVINMAQSASGEFD